jgi:hypothetical protein
MRGHHPDGKLWTTSCICTSLDSVGGRIEAIRQKDDSEDVLKRKWLKLAYTAL